MDDHGFQNSYPEYSNENQENNQPQSRWKDFTFRLRDFLSRTPKRNLAVYFLVLLIAVGGVFLVTKQIFKADTGGPYNISGKIYGQDTKKALADVDISLSSQSNTDAQPITAKTDAGGQYSISAPDGSFTNISISKDNYESIDGIITNASTLNNINFNFALKSGFGASEVEIVSTAVQCSGVFDPSCRTRGFGLSLTPDSDSPASITEITPQGDTYSSNSIASSLLFFDPKTSGFVRYDDTKTTIENQMASVSQIANACKTYAGESKVNIAHQTNTSDPPADGGASLQAGNQPICDTSTISDPNQKNQATGNYPKLPDGYSYYIYRDFDMSFSSFVIVRFSPTTQGDIGLPLLHCDYNGCARENNWGSNLSLYKGQGLVYTSKDQTPHTFTIRGKYSNSPLETKATQKNKTYYLANPYMRDIKLSDFLVKDGTNQYDLPTAVDKGYISKNFTYSAFGKANVVSAKNSDDLSKTLSSGNVIGVTTLSKTFSLTPSHTLAVKGKITAKDKSAISDAKIVLASSDSNFDQSVEATTAADGTFNLAADDTSYDQALVTKDGFQDTYIHIQNGGKIADITADISLEPGFGTTQIEMIPVKSGVTTTFGLPINPNDQFAVTKNVENTDAVQSFELSKGQNVPVRADHFDVNSAGLIDQELSKNTATYSPTDDNIYLFGGLDNTDHKPTTAIYSYTPSDQTDNYIADLPVPLYDATSINIPNQNLILIIGGKSTDNQSTGKVYGFFTDSLKTFAIGDISAADRYSSILIGSDIYIFAEGSDIKIFKFSISDLVSRLTSNNCYPASEADCNVGLFSSPASTQSGVPLGAMPFYSSITNKIYLVGGTTSSQPTTNIYSIAPDLGNFQKESAVLPYPVSDAAYFIDSSSQKLYIFGGLTSNNSTTDKGMVVQVTTGNLTVTELPNFKLKNPVATFAYASDKNSNYYIFSSTAINFEDPPPAGQREIQMISPEASFRAGQVYSINPSADNNLSFSYSESDDLNSESNQSPPDPISDFYVNHPGTTYKFSTSATDPESLSQYKITKLDDSGNVNEYNLIDAAKNGLIENTIKINNQSIDATKISTKDLKSTFVYPSDIFSFTDKADSVFSKDGNQIQPDYNNGYEFIPQVTQAFQTAGFTDDEINNILDQLDNCDPNFYTISTTDDQRNSCINSLQLPDSSPVSMEKSKSILSQLIPTASAMNTSDAVKIIKQNTHWSGIKPEDIPPGILRDYIKHANQVGETGWLAKLFSTTPEDWFFQNFTKYKQRITNDWSQFAEETLGNYFYQKYGFNDSPDHYSDEVNICQSSTGKETFLTKKYWRPKDINTLYRVYWDKDTHKGDKDFTPTEKAYLSGQWNGKHGLNNVCNKFKGMPNWEWNLNLVLAAIPGGLIGKSPAFSSLKYSTETAWGGNPAVLAKTLLERGTVPATKVSAVEVAGAKAWGVSENEFINELSNQATNYLKPKTYDTPSLRFFDKNTGAEYNSTMIIDFAKKGSKLQYTSAQSLKKGYDNIIAAIDDYANHPWTEYMNERASLSVNKNRMYYSVSHSKPILNKESVGVAHMDADCGGNYLCFTESFFAASNKAQFRVIWHEEEHVNQVGLWDSKYYLGYNTQTGAKEGIRPFYEGAAEFLTQNRYTQKFGTDNLSTSSLPYINTAYQSQTAMFVYIREALMRVHGINSEQATNMIARVNYTQSWDTGIDTLLGSYARDAGVVGPNITFTQRLYNEIKKGHWTGHDGVYSIIDKIGR